jgi:hypothetical protein
MANVVVQDFEQQVCSEASTGIIIWLQRGHDFLIIFCAGTFLPTVAKMSRRNREVKVAVTMESQFPYLFSMDQVQAWCCALIELGYL